MSVSSRSPMTSGRLRAGADDRLAVQRRLGLARDLTGLTPVACSMTWSSEPLPGAVPRALGIVESALVATKSAPARTARPPSAKLP